jgi:NAD(P)H-hydrate repair Nnr-like enzyme with NAD(P)H-hydrate epimerase domain
LARVERPTGDGYWAAHFVLKPGDDVDAALAHLSEEQQTAIKRELSDIENKDAEVSIYVKPEGGYELFFS